MRVGAMTERHKQVVSGFDLLLLTIENEIPGVAGGIDIGESQGGGACFDACGDQFFCGQGAVLKTKIGLGEVHRKVLWKQSYELTNIFST